MIGKEKLGLPIPIIINGHNGFSFNYLNLGIMKKQIKLKALTL